jgi:hypothetical protein
MTPHADLSDPIPPTPDDPGPTGGAPPTGGRPDFLTRIGRTSAYLLAQQGLYSDGREGLPVVRVGRQLRVPRRALERLAGGELTPVLAPPPELRAVPVPSTATPTGALTDDDTPPNAESHTRNHAPSAKPRARDRDTRATHPSLFPTDR